MKFPLGRQNPVNSNQSQWCKLEISFPLEKRRYTVSCSTRESPYTAAEPLPAGTVTHWGKPLCRVLGSSDLQLMLSMHPCPPTQVWHLLHLAQYLYLLLDTLWQKQCYVSAKSFVCTHAGEKRIVPKISCKRKTVAFPAPTSVFRHQTPPFWPHLRHKPAIKSQKW